VTLAIAEVNQCNAELTILSNAQKDYQERMDDIHQTVSNASNVIAKYLNITSRKVGFGLLFPRLFASRGPSAWWVRTVRVEGFAQVSSAFFACP
jgi:hypothetical protein